MRLADTDLWLSPTEDLTRPGGAAGDEAVFGGGKVIRESMGQATRSTVDLVITNALVLDWWGVVKADVGVRDGRIVAMGKAGNPDITDGVHPDLVIGPGTEVLAGEGKILTAGAIDCHVHLICPQIARRGAGRRDHHDHRRRHRPGRGHQGHHRARPAPWYLARMLEALDAWPVNVALLAKGNTVSAAELDLAARSGAAGYKLHEDWGTTPAAIDACLPACDRFGLQAAIHTDTLNEAGYVEPTLAAIGGRAIHAYHTEGAGGGHAPDIITVASQANVLPSSTNPTRPHTVNTLAEHLDMLMVCHHLNPGVAEDLAFAESRIRPSTIAAEDWLHDLGAISIIGSDSQAMGRVGEVITRTFQTAHVMKARRGAAGRRAGAGADNLRARRYIAKVTICPAQAHGLDDEVGSIEVGQAGRPGAVGPGLLRRAPGGRGQGRGDRLGADGRRQRLDPHPPAGAGPADVRPLTGRRRPRWPGWRRPPWRTGWPTAWPCAVRCVAVRGHAGPGQGRPAGERRPARTSRSTRARSPCASTARSSIEDPVAVLPLAQRYALF